MAGINIKKRYSVASELQAIFTLCHDGKARSEQAASMLLASLTPDHFVTPIGEACYSRIRHLLKTRGELPELADLFEDPGIEADTRQSLIVQHRNGLRGLNNAIKARKLVNRLDTYRKIRALFEMGANLEAALSEDRVDPDQIIADMATDITNAGSSSRRMRVTSRGDGNTTLETAKKILLGNGPVFIPTGFIGFDGTNHGIPRGGFMLLSTITGGGKSIMASQIAENMAMAGAKVGFIPLEMDTEEMTMRDMARAAKVDMTNLLAPKKSLSLEQRRRIFKDYRKATLAIDKRGGSVKFIEPGGDIDIYTLLGELKPFEFDVIVIDYVGLLKGADGERQWQELGNITRYCKIFAGLHKCVIIMAAQLSSEGLLKYSRTMEEHAPYHWKWQQDEVAREMGILVITQPKARQAKQFDFYLKIDPEIMTIRDATREEIANYLDAVEEAKNNNRRQSRKGHNYGSRTDDDDRADDEEEEKHRPKRKGNKRYDNDSGHGRGKWSPNYGGRSSKSGKRNRFEEEF